MVNEYAEALKDLDGTQAALLLSSQNVNASMIQQVLAIQQLSPALQQQALLEAGLLKSKKNLSNAEIEETLQT